MTAARSCVAGFSTCPRVRRARSAWEVSPASPPKSFHKSIKRVLAPLSQNLCGWVLRPEQAPEPAARRNGPPSRDGGLHFRRYANDRPERRALQETLRIDVDLELEVPSGLRACGEPVPQVIREVEAACRFQQKAEAVTSLDHRERRLRRPQHLYVLVARRERGQSARKTFRGWAV